MKFAKLLTMAVAISLVAACSNVPRDGVTKRPYEYDLISAPLSEVGAIQPSGSTFTKGLYKGYYERAGHEAREWDYPAANRYLNRAKAAAGGEVVMPEDPSHWTVPTENMGELLSARERLITALVKKGRNEMPDVGAEAQVMYDCWVEEQAENTQPEDIAFCKQGFLAAIEKLEYVPPPAPPPAAAPAPQPEPPSNDYLVFFDWDRSDIRSDSASILDRVAEAVGQLKASKVQLVGHADRSGSDAYNQRLSERRAHAVRSYLEGKGISGDYTEEGRGESDPRVPTPDGVREQENRRVEIHIE